MIHHWRKYFLRFNFIFIVHSFDFWIARSGRV